jgi:hypothetical protein
MLCSNEIKHCHGVDIAAAKGQFLKLATTISLKFLVSESMYCLPLLHRLGVSHHRVGILLLAAITITQSW